MMDFLKIVAGLILLSSGAYVQDADAANVEQKYHITREGNNIIMSPVTVTDAPNITIIYDRGSNKPKIVVVGPKLKKADGQTIVLGDGTVLM